MNSENKKTFVGRLSIIVGVYFLISSIGKSFDLGGFMFGLSKTEIPGLIFLAPLIVLFELGISLALLFSFKTRYAAMLAFFTVLVYTIACLFANAFHSVDSCACCGIFSNLSHFDKPIVVVMINLCIMAFSFFVYKNSFNFSKNIKSWQPYLAIGSFIIFSYIMGFTTSNKLDFGSNLPGKKVDFDFRDEKLSNTPFANYQLKFNDNSVNMIFCFDYSCPYFWNSMANLEAYIKCGAIDSIILIGTDSHNQKEIFEEAFGYSLNSTHVDTSDFRKSIKISPCAYFVINDTIKYQIPGTLPAIQNIQKLLIPKKNEKI